MNKTIRYITACLLLVAAVAAHGDTPLNDDAAIARNLDVFNSLYKELNTFYVDTINAQKSIETAIDAMLDELDPYTEYIPADEQEDFRVISTGEYGGIGSYIMQRTGARKGVYISSPYENSPAARAGLKPGDRIVSIDGERVDSLEQDKISARLKGQANTMVRVGVVRPYVDDSLLTFNIKRETIKMSPVTYYGITRGNIGYIGLSTFNEHSASEVKEALVELKKNPNLRCVVLDLRSNGGGVMEGAVQIVGHFVPKGTTVVVTRGRDKQTEKTYKTTAEPVDTKIPLVVLIDNGSASASEITAGALQDLDRAVIMGTRSYGKGLVQTTRPLPFDGLLKVTMARYYIPSGRLIQEIDYSHRDANGRYQRIPDSLAHEFTTAHGRIVRDGGGITPDIEVKPAEASRVVYNIVRDHWAFDYATRYASEHPTIPDPDHFEVTDEMWTDFKQSIDPDKFEYDKVCEKGLEALRKLAETEGYMNDSTRKAFDHLDTLLRHDLDHDLDLHEEEIKALIAQEIMDRYYYQRGQAQYAVRYDKCINRVLEMLNTPGEYERTLNIGKAATTSTKKSKTKKSTK